MVFMTNGPCPTMGSSIGSPLKHGSRVLVGGLDGPIDVNGESWNLEMQVHGSSPEGARRESGTGLSGGLIPLFWVRRGCSSCN